MLVMAGRSSPSAAQVKHLNKSLSKPERGCAAPTPPGFLPHPEMLTGVQGEETHALMGVLPLRGSSQFYVKLDTPQASP